MNINACATNLLGYYAPEERSIPDNATYPGRNAAVMKAMNHASQELFGKGKPWVRHDERGAVLFAPAAVSIAVTTGSTAGAITGWLSWMAGCTIVIDGMSIDNQIRNASSTARLKYPYSGPSGTYAATVYHDSLEVDSDVFEIHEPVKLDGLNIGSLSTPSALAVRSSSDFGFVGQRATVVTSSSSAGKPVGYVIDSWSPDAAAPPLLRLRLFPAPADQHFLEYSVMLCPPQITDLSSTASLPIPFGNVESIFLPLAVAALRKSPFWRGIVGEDSVNEGHKAALEALTEANPKKTIAPRFIPIF